MDAMEMAFKKYFNNTSTEQDLSGIISKEPKKAINPRKNVEDNVFTIDEIALMADGNIDGIEQLCNVLKKLLNAAWGSNWGEISPDLKKGEDSAKIIIPQITAEINNRDISEDMPLKPVLMSTIKEEVNGKETGDSFLIYRQWFDNVIEFDFYARTSKEARDLQSRFESLLAIYSGYLKRKGVSEIVFLKEVSAKNSLNFTEQTPMKCLMYWVRFERITPIRQSLINQINADIGIKSVNNEKIQTVIKSNVENIDYITSENDPAEIEFDFFNQDTGVEFKENI